MKSSEKPTLKRFSPSSLKINNKRKRGASLMRSNYKYKHLFGGGVHRVDVQYKTTFLNILIGYNNTSTTVL